MPEWFVYILQCCDNTLYTGVTTDPVRRLKEHNNDKSVTRYTRARQPVELVYHEPAANRRQACRRESEIKRLTRQKKLRLISREI